MRHRDSRILRVLAGLLVTATLGPVAEAQLEPLGAPRVIDLIAGRSELAVDPRGRFAAIWEKRYLIAAEMFDEDGRSAGPRFTIRDRDPKAESLRLGPIAVDGFGSYLVSWEAVRPSASGGLDLLIRARFYGPSGKPQSAQIDVETSDSSPYLFVSSAARNRRGDAVLIWSQQDGDGTSVRRAQRFDGRNRPVGGKIDLPPLAGGEVAIDDLGRFVVVFGENEPGDFTVHRYLFQRFRRDGVQLGKTKLVTRRAKQWVLVANEPSGEFAISWLEDGSGVQVLFYDAFGRPLSGAVRVTEGDGPPSSMVRDRFGNTVITWEAGACCTSLPHIFARVYDRLGNPLGEAIELAPAHYVSSSGMDDDGNMVVTWLEPSGNHVALAFQRFRLTCAPGYEDRCP